MNAKIKASLAYKLEKTGSRFTTDNTKNNPIRPGGKGWKVSTPISTFENFLAI